MEPTPPVDMIFSEGCLIWFVSSQTGRPTAMLHHREDEQNRSDLISPDRSTEDHDSLCIALVRMADRPALHTFQLEPSVGRTRPSPRGVPRRVRGHRRRVDTDAPRALRPTPFGTARRPRLAPRRCPAMDAATGFSTGATGFSGQFAHCHTSGANSGQFTK